MVEVLVSIIAVFVLFSAFFGWMWWSELQGRKELEEQYDTCVESLNWWRQECNAMTFKRDKLQEENETLQDAIRELTIENASQKQDYEVLRGAINKLDATLETKEADLAGMEVSHAAAWREVHELREQVADLTSNIETLKAALDEKTLPDLSSMGLVDVMTGNSLTVTPLDDETVEAITPPKQKSWWTPFSR